MLNAIATDLGRHFGRSSARRHDLANTLEVAAVPPSSEQILRDALRQVKSFRRDIAAILTRLDDATVAELYTRLAKLGNDLGKLRERTSALRVAIEAENA